MKTLPPDSNEGIQFYKCISVAGPYLQCTLASLFTPVLHSLTPISSLSLLFNSLWTKLFTSDLCIIILCVYVVCFPFLGAFTRL